MRGKIIRNAAAVSAIAVGLVGASNAWAQEQPPVDIAPPPSIETNSPGGVDMTSGAYSMQSADLQIGGGAFPNGLTLVRSYNSSSGDVFSAFAARGWSHNWTMQVTQAPIPRDYFGSGLDDPECQGSLFPENCNILTTEFYTVIAFGNGSAKYTNGQTGSGSGENIPGLYNPLEAHNLSQKLEFVAAPGSNNQHVDGHYEFTDSDGTLYVFNSFTGGNKISHIIAPNGVRANVQGGFVSTSNGYALLFEGNGPNNRPSKACVVNLATTHVEAGDDCPANALSVTYGYDQVPVDYPSVAYRPARTEQIWQLASVTNALGEAMTYGYDDGQHVNCVKDNGQNQCRVQMTYSTCVYDLDLQNASPLPPELPEIHLSEKVLTQQMVTGEQLSYYYADLSTSGSDYCPGEPDLGGYNGFTDAESNDTRLTMFLNRAQAIRDPLDRMTEQSFWNPSSIPQIPGVTFGTGPLASRTLPEGNKVEVDYNDRGLVIETRTIAKPGSGAPTLVTRASYPADCTDTTRKICNKPLTSTDANGNVTSYEYSAAHGGVTRVRGPAVNGVRPETRYTYGQKYAWLKNAGGGYSRAASPVWVLVSERSCTNSAMNSAGNCANSGDLVVTTYEYQAGSASKGSNVWLLGTAVTATNGAGQTETLRTCRTYDDLGRVTSETPPRANLSSCN